MSEEGKMSSPHYGIFPFDPEARPQSEVLSDQVTLDEKQLEAKAIYQDPEGNRIRLNPEIPYTHKWFVGEFHTAPWGKDKSPYMGKSVERVRVSMPGKRMRVEVHNHIQSVRGTITAVSDPEDRHLIGESGWWRTENLSHSAKKRRKKV